MMCIYIYNSIIYILYIYVLYILYIHKYDWCGIWGSPIFGGHPYQLTFNPPQLLGLGTWA